MDLLKIDKSVSVRDILCFNPYDVESNLSGKGLTEDDFKYFFVLIKEFKEYGGYVKNYITPGDVHKNILILHGYSGSGKTTFLNWLKKDYLPSDYYFDITNLTRMPVAQAGDNIIRKVIKLKLKELLKNPKGPRLIAENEDLLRSFITDNQFITNLMSIYLDIVNTGEYDDNKINEYLGNLAFKDLLFIYIIEKIKRIDLEDYINITFCFDNLDEIKYEYLTEELWEDFKEVRKNLILFFQGNPSGLRFDFKSKFTFILSFREANLIIRSAQYLDRIDLNFDRLKLVLTESAKRIVSKRCHILKTYFIDNYRKSPISYLTRIISNEVFTDSFYLPLFNYDYRKLMHAIVEMGTSREFEYLKLISYSRYKSIASLSRRIARGAIVHRIIRYLIYKNYIMEFATLPTDPSSLKAKGFCRKSRLLLTIIYRFSYPKGVKADNYKQKQEIPNRRSLKDVFLSFTELLPQDREFFGLIDMFFNIKDSSWAHLISIYNTSGERIKINFDNEKRMYDKVLVGTHSKIEFLDRLSKYDIHINASGVIYLRDILIHFEYFTNIVNQRTNRNNKSIIESLEFLKEQNKFEFQIIIEKVIKKLASYKNNIDAFIKHNIEENGNGLEWYLSEEYVFQRHENKSPSLYFTRIVTSHSEYLDRFRKFIFKDKKFNAIISSSPFSIEDVNKYLIDRIEDYNKLLGRGYQDNISIPYVRNKTEKIKEVRRHGYANWISIEKERT